MEFINHTNYPALLFRTGVEENKYATSVCLRVTYDIKSSKAIPSPEQNWPLFKMPWKSEFGPMDNDNIYKRGGVDILIFGKAKAPGGNRIKRMEVRVDMQKKLSHKILVIGNRIWEKTIFGIAISDTEPFLEMPLTLGNAYGGIAKWDGLEIPYGNNPNGKGYYWQKEDAANNPLPNVENPLRLIQNWNDQPDPVGLVSCPMNELRLRNNVKYTDAGQITEILPRIFNSAFPAMIVDSVTPGEQIVINGMTNTNPYVFEIPKHIFKTKVAVGEKTNEWPLYIEQVGILPCKDQAFITYRFPFRYTFTPHQKRTCEIFEL